MEGERRGVNVLPRWSLFTPWPVLATTCTQYGVPLSVGH